MPRPDVVGLRDIATRLDVPYGTVRQWWLRTQRGQGKHPMPAARWTVNGHPAWEYKDVAAWWEGRVEKD